LNSKGEIWTHKLHHDHYDSPRHAQSPPVGHTRHVVYNNHGVGVVNEKGELWLHPGHFHESFGSPEHHHTDPIALNPEHDRTVFLWGPKVVVLNSKGEAWAHTWKH